MSISIKRKIEFIFNNISGNLEIPLKYLLEQKDTLNLIIVKECIKKVKQEFIEDNIILYDINNDIFINTVQDLVENKTIKCKIIIKPVEY